MQTDHPNNLYAPKQEQYVQHNSPANGLAAKRDICNLSFWTKEIGQRFVDVIWRQMPDTMQIATKLFHSYVHLSLDILLFQYV